MSTRRRPDRATPVLRATRSHDGARLRQLQPDRQAVPFNSGHTCGRWYRGVGRRGTGLRRALAHGDPRQDRYLRRLRPHQATPDADESRRVREEINRAEVMQRPILPLLLKGYAFFGLGLTHYHSVVGGEMPRSDYVARLAKMVADEPERGPTAKPEPVLSGRLLHTPWAQPVGARGGLVGRRPAPGVGSRADATVRIWETTTFTLSACFVTAGAWCAPGMVVERLATSPWPGMTATASSGTRSTIRTPRPRRSPQRHRRHRFRPDGPIGGHRRRGSRMRLWDATTRPTWSRVVRTPRRRGFGRLGDGRAGHRHRKPR